MIYLALAVICSSSIALIFKYSETSRMDRYVVTTANYVVAVTVSSLLLFLSDSSILSGLAGAGWILECWQGGPSTGDCLSASSGGWGLLIGIPAGLMFFLAFIVYQISVRQHGVGLSGSFAKLGILVPLLLSLLVWHERIQGFQWLGLALSAGAIALANLPKKEREGSAIRLMLLLLLLFGGLAEFSNKIFQHYGGLEGRPFFLVSTFGVALIASASYTLRRGAVWRKQDLLAGILVGLPNVFSSYFLIEALQHIPAAVAFSVFGAGSIVVITAGGRFLFRERLQPVDFIVVGLAALGVVAVNV